MAVKVRLATHARFADVRKVLAPRNPDVEACWCLYFRLDSGEFSELAGDERPQRLEALTKKRPAPGVLAYVGDEPVGWCSVGPRDDMARLLRSRTIQQIDDRPVWSIVCFVVRPAHRREGVATALLDGAIRFAQSHGATVLEAYPVEDGSGSLEATAAYPGTVSMFEEAGFSTCEVTRSRSGNRPRWIVRMDL